MFQIEIKFVGGFSGEQKLVSKQAAMRWERVLTEKLEPMPLGNRIVDDVLVYIGATGSYGVNMLGEAGILAKRPDGGLPYAGKIDLNRNKLPLIERDGRLEDVICHELGHVLGLGNLWKERDLLQSVSSTRNYIGKNGLSEYRRLANVFANGVPVAAGSSSGSGGNHWSELVFYDELMTGLMPGTTNPISRITLGALEDLGYSVDYSLAEDYQLPDHPVEMVRFAKHGDALGPGGYGEVSIPELLIS